MLTTAVESRTEEIVVMTMIAVRENGMIGRAVKAALKGDRWRAEEKIIMRTVIQEILPETEGLTEGAANTPKRMDAVKEMRVEGAVTGIRTRRVGGSVMQNTWS